MRVLPDGMQAHLDTGATTLAACWRVTRADGTVYGFTDHDRDLAFDGTTFEAATGFEAGETVSSLGLNVDNVDVAGALSSARLSEEALAAGLFDNAAIEVFIVNWEDTNQRVLAKTGNLGEVSRSDTAFTAEIRGLAHTLNQPKGRVFQFACDADLGDARCGIDLEAAAYKGAGTVAAVPEQATFTATGLDGFEAGWFTRGLVTWTAGANAGRGMEVKTHRLSASAVTIDLWQPMSKPVQPGDTFDIRAGCDKQFATCRAKFANQLNFRGFPHMPGNDFVMSYPLPGEARHDGGSLNE